MISSLKQYLKNKLFLSLDKYISSKITDMSFLEQIEASWESYLHVKHYMHKSIIVEDDISVLDIALDSCSISGLYLEFGVFKGRTINYMSGKFSDKCFYGFDSFEGLPERWRHNFNKSAFDTQGRLPKVNSNVKLIKGWFDNTLPSFLEDNSCPVSFLHIDCDLYSSTKTVLDMLKQRIISGTIIVFDEYFNYPGWRQHEYRAFQEFVKSNDIEYDYLAFNSKHEQVVVRIL